MASSQTLSIIIEAIDKASGVAGQVSKTFKDVGADLVKTGAGLGLATAPAVAAFTDAARQATTFQETMINTQSILGATSGEIAILSDEILRMGLNSREGPQALAEAMGEIAGGVEDASIHMSILETAMRTSEAGAAGLEGTTSALVSIMNSYGFAAEDAAMVSDVLTQTVGMGVVSMDELASAIPNVTGLASSLDVEFSELGAAIAFMTTQGFSGSVAATQLRASMVAMLNPNETMKQALDELGVASGALLVEQEGLVGALTKVAGTSTVAEQGLAKTLGSTEALTAALGLTSEEAEAFLETFEESMEGATDAAHDVQMGSVAAQMDILNSTVDTLRISLGMALLPVINRVLIGVQPFVATLVAWVQNNQDVVLTVAKVVAGVAAFAAVLTTVGGILAAVGTGIGLLASPIALVVAALAGLGLAYRENFLGFGDAVNDVVSRFKAFGTDLMNVVKTGDLSAVGQFIWDTIKNGFPVVKGWVDSHIVQPIKTALDGVSWADVASTAKDAGNTVLDAVATGAEKVGTWVYDNLIDPIINEINAVDWGTLITDTGNFLWGILEAVGEFAIDWYTWLWDNLYSPLINEITAFDWGTALTDGANFLSDLLNTLASGAVEFGSWVKFNIVYPLVEHIKAVDWGSYLETGGNILESILNAAAGVVVDFGTWIKTNLVDPVLNALNLQDWSLGLGAEHSIIGRILEAAGEVVSDIASWVNEHIAKPIGEALSNIDWSSVLSTVASGAFSVLKAILGAIALVGLELVNFGAWVLENVAEPIASALIEVDWSEVINSAGNVFYQIFSGIKDGLVDIAQWVLSRIANPISKGLTGVDWVGLLKDVGSLILDAIASGLGNVGQWAYDKIVAPIKSAIEGAFGGDAGSGGGGGGGREFGGSGGGAAPSTNSPGIGSSGAFGRSRDSGGLGQANVTYLIGRGAQPELFIPHTAGTFVPAGEYAAVGAGLPGGAGRSGQPVVIQFDYRPTISMADEREAEYQIKPTIERILRANGVI